MKDFDSDHRATSARPSAPHFDDEETLVSARPVVPIATAKSSERLRIVRRALPFIVIAGLIGILIGGGIGFYAKRRTSANVVNESSTTPETKQNEAAREQQRVAPPSQSPEIETKPDISSNSTENQSPALEIKIANASADRASRVKGARRPLIRIVATASSNRRKASIRRGAARIQEIFAGSSP